MIPVYRENLKVIIEAIEGEKDIIPFIPGDWLSELRKKPAYVDALVDAGFLLGLTDEILPEYSVFLKSKKAWLERQLELLREEVR